MAIRNRVPLRSRITHSILALWLASALPTGAAIAHEDLKDAIHTGTHRIAASGQPALEYLLRGEHYRLKGEWSKALADYNSAARLDPRLPGLDLCRAQLLFDRGRHAQAHAALTRLTAREPGETRAWALRAEAAEALGRRLDAAEDLARAIAAARTPSPDYYVERARLLASAGKTDEALRTLDDGIRILGPIASLELPASELDAQRGNTRAAIARIDRVKAQARQPAALTERKAAILTASGDVEGARWLRANTSAIWSPSRSRSSLPVATLAAHEAPMTQVATALEPAPAPAVPARTAAVLTRGPYLQIATTSSITIRWRTDVASDSRVSYGTAVGSLTSRKDDATLTTEHEVTVTGLASGQRYFYSIGSTTEVLEGDDAAHTFATLPSPSSSGPSRIWVIGDAGTGQSEQLAVRDSWNTYNNGKPADVWLMLGDNAYDSGTDTEYQTRLFNIYRTQLRNTTLWPTRGNHDVVRTGANNDYYEFFNMPTAGQSGGLASGTEAYYSFDYANIHFICLDSEGTTRLPTGAMATWLKNDIAGTDRDWVIAYWHHPPYTKGSHDSDNTSDSGGRMRDMRAYILPIMDSLGVDLVLTGHSHSYERSFLLDRHYGVSTTLTNAMKIDAGNGKETGTGAYRKSTLGTGPHEGAVYAVAGSSGQISGGSLNHPVMVSSLNVAGSMVLDITGNRLDARFLDKGGVIRDNFTMIKGSGGPIVDTVPPAAVSNLRTSN